MKYFSALLIALISSPSLQAQVLPLKPRQANALSGSEFATSTADSSLSLADRENLIFSEIKKGNVPSFLRKLKAVTDSAEIDGKIYSITYYVLPDYLAVGSNGNFFYVPMTPVLAQQIAELTKCSLPTKRMVDAIYEAAVDGKAIQPLYNKHSNTWAEDSHGVRLVQQKVWLNGKKTSLAKVLADPKLHVLLSDESVIIKPFYPNTKY